MSISREDFIKRWDNKCAKCFGLGHEDLPDIILIDDYWYEGIDGEDLQMSILTMTEVMMEEMGSDGFC